MVVWYLHAIERDDGSWACRHGLTEFDDHPTLIQALDHLAALAGDDFPAQLIVHRLDGDVQRVI
jgi:hypothetical protein